MSIEFPELEWQHLPSSHEDLPRKVPKVDLVELPTKFRKMSACNMYLGVAAAH